MRWDASSQQVGQTETTRLMRRMLGDGDEDIAEGGDEEAEDEGVQGEGEKAEDLDA